MSNIEDSAISIVTESKNDGTLQEEVEVLCRLCALPTSSNMLRSIYDDNIDNKINTILPLQVSKCRIICL